MLAWREANNVDRRVDAVALWLTAAGGCSIRQEIVQGDLKPSDHPLYDTIMKYW